MYNYLVKTPLNLSEQSADFESGKYLRYSVSEIDQNDAPILRERLIKEYNATTISEVMVIELMVNAYFRSLQSAKAYSLMLMDRTGGIANGQQTEINAFKEISKQIEIANRQFMTALTFLKELKQPGIQVKIEAKEAYFGRNQQINK